jgi:hypothetical protein
VVDSGCVVGGGFVNLALEKERERVTMGGKVRFEVKLEMSPEWLQLCLSWKAWQKSMEH